MYANKPPRGHKMDIVAIKAKHAASHVADKKSTKKTADIGVGRQNFPGTQSGSSRNR